jgi:16S rRNA (guanine527-N7)-methyltransferase
MELGFLGSIDLPEQIDHALGFVFVVEREWPHGPPRALDLGTGGGVPGLVLGACWPDCRLTLLDAGRRRVEFLRREIAGHSWAGNVDVVRGRAEELGQEPDLRSQFDLVTARSFGPPAVAAECGSPFLRLGGIMVVSEPPGGAGQRWPEEGLARLGLVTGDSAGFGKRFGYQVLRQAEVTPERYPRRTGVPAKRPLF